jgi:hypothetical protein
MNAKGSYQLIGFLGVGGGLGTVGGILAAAFIGVPAMHECARQAPSIFNDCDSAIAIWGIIGTLPGALLALGGWIATKLGGEK